MKWGSLSPNSDKETPCLDSHVHQTGKLTTLVCIADSPWPLNVIPLASYMVVLDIPRVCTQFNVNLVAEICKITPTTAIHQIAILLMLAMAAWINLAIVGIARPPFPGC